MDYKGINQAKKETGLSYLGLVNNSTKHVKAFKYNEMVYTIYLAPGNSSGYEVCPGRTSECTSLCLNSSGRNKMDIKKEMINASRIKKVRLFFEEKNYFMKWLIDDIKKSYNKAMEQGFYFSVRLNNTSDISPEDFYIIDNGVKQNILEIFPHIQFYDYTKVFDRESLTKKYSNYDLTYSFTGRNWSECLDLLNKGERITVVFNKVPETYLGFEVVDGDKYDMRYRDPKGVIIGLKFKKVRNKLTNDNKFVIQ